MFSEVNDMYSNEDLAWLAGFFDGEGTTYLADGRPEIWIGQKDKRVLEKVKLIYNKGHIEGPYIRKLVSGKETYIHRYRISKQEDSLEFILLIWPWISEAKREQALTVINKWNQIKLERKIASQFCRKGHSLYNARIYGDGKKHCLMCEKIRGKLRNKHDAGIVRLM